MSCNAAVIGVGGIGGYIASALASAGSCKTVSAVARRGSPVFQELKRTGGEINFRLTTNGAYKPTVKVPPINVLESADLAAGGTGCAHHDVVFLCTKAHQAPSVAPSLSALVGPGTVIVPCMNGLPFWFANRRPIASFAIDRHVDPDSAIRNATEKGHVVGTALFVAAHFDPQNRIWHSPRESSKNFIVVGNTEMRSCLEATRKVEGLFSKNAEVPLGIKITDDIYGEVFGKMLMNCSMNPISTLTRASCGDIIADEALHRLLDDVCNEAIAVASALEIKPSIGLKEIVDILKGHQHHKTSMLLDYEAGKKLENSPILDAMVVLADSCGVDVPVMRDMSIMIRELENISHNSSDSINLG